MQSSIMGDRKENIKQQKILNRMVTWSDKCIEYEAEPRHAEIIMGYDNEAKTSTVPGCKGILDRDYTLELFADQATQYRVAAARCNFLAIDRPDT